MWGSMTHWSCISWKPIGSLVLSPVAHANTNCVEHFFSSRAVMGSIHVKRYDHAVSDGG
jgi:hypothetical protein